MSIQLDEKTLKVWEKAKKVSTVPAGNGNKFTIDTEVYRQDPCNAWIKKDEYGKKSDFGWEKDHVLPEAKDGTDHIDNLRPMHWKNNRSKDDDFPGYKRVITAEGSKNKNIDDSRTVNDETIQLLKKLYPNNKYLKDL